MTESPIVRVEEGELQGKVTNSPSGKAFYSFQGIPYAKPPIGSLRFRAPQPAEAWEGVRDATSEGNSCAQIEPFFHKEYIGDENCLFLNVSTPNLDGEFLPVMVFVHGVGFRIGSGSSLLYGADYLVEKDVVLVTINYRCGPLGFLCLNTPEVPGNAGLKDVVQALRWVKQNIKNFGGNSGNITVFGESAGGAITSLLTASPLTKNLISRAIIQSGTALNFWARQTTPIENAIKLANELGCESADIDEILEFLSTTPVRDIIESNERMSTLEFDYKNGKTMFSPVVEKEFPGVEAFQTEAFIDILASGRVADVPIMIGSSTLECGFDRNCEDLQAYIPEDLQVEWNSEQSLAIADRIKSLYFTGNPNSVESLTERFHLTSDYLINIDTHRYVKFLVKNSNKPIYYYKFDYIGELNISHNILSVLDIKRAGHMDELNYLFRTEVLEDVEPTPQDIKMRERMVRLWTNFAKGGNPTPDENHYITVTWLPVTKDNLYYLNLGNELSLRTNPDNEKMEFWDELYEKCYKIWNHPKVNEAASPVSEKSSTAPVIVEETIITTVTTVNNEIETSESYVHVTDSVENSVQLEETIEDPVQNDVVQDIVIYENAEDVVPTEVQVVDHEDFGVNISKIQEKFEMSQNGVEEHNLNGSSERKPRPSNEIKMVQNSNANPKDVIRANDPPEDDLPKNIGVNKFVNFFESLGGKK